MLYVYSRLLGKDKDIPVPTECVFKIHKTTLNEFSRRRDYIDSRHSNMINNKTKKLIEVWAMKEVHNLNRLRRAGIMCPEVVAHRKQILLLSFIGMWWLIANKYFYLGLLVCGGSSQTNTFT